jgi:hypothetical protein
MDFINALPGNSFVNTNTGNNRREAVFSVRSAPNNAYSYGKWVTRQSSCKHASTTMGDDVFRLLRIKKFS